MKIIYAGEMDFEELWDRGSNEIIGAAPFHTLYLRKYYKLYFGDKIVFDDSFVVVSPSGKVLALVPLYAFRKDKKRIDYCFGEEYLHGPLISSSVQSQNFQNTSKLIFATIENLAVKKEICAHWAMIEPFELIEGRHYYNYLLDFGYSDESSVTNIVESDKSEEELWMKLRKSYKSLINRAERTYKSICVNKDNFNVELCEEYRKLHALACGRVTRCSESYFEIYEIIKNGKAFLILIKDKEEKTIGAYYFLVQGIYAFYGSAATDPSLPPQSGVGHMGLWKGISVARELGCKFLDLGQLLVRKTITEKEKNIDLFKRGFGGKRVTVFRGIKYFMPD